MARKKKVNQDLVKMSVDAGIQRKTYGELQAEETVKKMREDSVMLTAKDKLALARYRKIGTVEEFIMHVFGKTYIPDRKTIFCLNKSSEI